MKFEPTPLSKLIRGLTEGQFAPGETIKAQGFEIVIISQDCLQITLGSQPPKRWLRAAHLPA